MKARMLISSMSAIGLCAAIAPGCLTRPVSSGSPVLKTNFTTSVKTAAVDKLDILFMIDNSASMGDKQAYLQAAVPDLINRLVTPNCVDTNDPNKVVGVSHDNGQCDQGQVEFQPVHDMHIGVISSSLGSRGSDDPTQKLCDAAAMASAPYNNLSRHNDDQAHLLGRSLTINGTSGSEGTVGDASHSGFLTWFPQVPANANKTPDAPDPITDPKSGIQRIQKDFEDLVTGVGFFGCGIESQLESWYRFLVQPDPYDHIDSSTKRAQWVGVDQTILKQRHDFLRPDSLVAVITLTDENDSEIDVRALKGTAYLFMNGSFNPPHGTSPCAQNPGDPNCTSCQFAANAASDPACAPPAAYTDIHDWGKDPNLRHVHMKAKYGVDVQFPIQRYVNGLTSSRVPDRTGEYPKPDGNYAGQNNCQNPLFAASLPDGSSTDPATLCNLPAGTRTKDLIFFAHIGGVPNQLLHFDPVSPENSELKDADWTKILGRDPEHYDYTGIDPHMIESYKPRQGVTTTPGGDPINGNDWITDKGDAHVLNVDREYACTFKLTTTRNCADPANEEACDCPKDNSLAPEQVPAVCDPQNPTQQTHAKAYPTIRELLLARKLGSQGIVSSICPIHVDDNASGTDPLYGYRPAIAAIVNRLKNALTAQCLPQKLVPGPDGNVPCLILATLPNPGDTCDKNLGLDVPDSQVLATFKQNQHAAWVAAGGTQSGRPDPATLTVCSVNQLQQADLVNGSCKQSSKPGWCYVSGAAAGTCSQAILFGGGAPPTGSTINLQCIEASTGDATSGGGTGGGGGADAGNP